MLNISTGNNSAVTHKLIIAIDQAYKYALVAGNNLDYLWILSREKTIPEEIRHSYLQKAKELGYQTQDLVWTSHD